MAAKIITFDIEFNVSVRQFFYIPEDYPTENKEINDLYDEIWESYSDEHQVNVLYEEVHAFELELEELDFQKISSYTIDNERIISNL